MERFFNTAGPVNPAKHYTLDPLHRWDLPEVLGHIDRERYFLVHAPRQTGKTTCLQALAKYVNRQGRLHCVYVSAEQGQAARQDVDKGVWSLLREIALSASLQLQDDFVRRNLRTIFEEAGAANACRELLTMWCQQSPKPLVLLLDEIDALVGNTLIAVLRQLRAGYCARDMMPFPHSIVLCGMRHLRDYRMELGEEGKQVLSEASPFNINSESLRLGDFSRDDIANLYAQHTDETGQKFGDGVRERVFELTQGQPWLVNTLAYDVCFRDQAGQNRSKTVTVGDIDAAKERLIQRRETHLDQLMAKLKQERVYRVVQNFLLGENCLVSEEDIEYVIDLGLLRQSPGKSLRVANPIYREIIPRALSSEMQRQVLPRRPAYVDQDGRLCIDWLMTEFQQFFRENSDSWLERFRYKEAGPHLILQAFLQRVVNGGGTIHREYALGRGRTDLVVTWPLSPCHPDERSEEGSPHLSKHGGILRFAQDDRKQIIVLELKLIHRNDGADTVMTKGLAQTSAYMDTCGATEGHLILFDRRKGKSWDERVWVKHEQAPDGKNITVWAM
ncbi:MAG: AAA-like domain-containing protein [Myxococcota bacterium]